MSQNVNLMLHCFSFLFMMSSLSTGLGLGLLVGAATSGALQNVLIARISLVGHMAAKVA